jgi:hypothetical protein
MGDYSKLYFHSQTRANLASPLFYFIFLKKITFFNATEIYAVPISSRRNTIRCEMVAIVFSIVVVDFFLGELNGSLLDLEKVVRYHHHHLLLPDLEKW